MPVRATILIVEDDAGVRQLIRARLGAADYSVHVARNGVEALDAITRYAPDAMILDINMPGLDGFGVLEHMRKPGSQRAPTLVLTARHNAGDVERAIRLGAKDYLAKPFDDRLLLSRVARLFRGRAPIHVEG